MRRGPNSLALLAQLGVTPWHFEPSTSSLGILQLPAGLSAARRGFIRAGGVDFDTGTEAIVAALDEMDRYTD